MEDRRCVFLYEFVTGGGFLEIDGTPVPDGSLLNEGEAMWRSVYDDLDRVPDVQVYGLRDSRIEPTRLPNVRSIDGHLREAIFGLAIQCDATLVIAPEFDGHLLRSIEAMEQFGVRLLGPGSQFVRITSDKTRTAETLASANVPVPTGGRVAVGSSLPASFPLPAVLKRNDGAGSMAEIVNSIDLADQQNVMRIEHLIPGLPCSISFFCRGEEKPIACPPMVQILSGGSSLEFGGGRRLLEKKLVARANQLGRDALAALPDATGYVGIDLILGDADDGSGDVVVEVNPRLTTSYIGLREIAETNLAEAMLAIAAGREPQISFSDRDVHFLADGSIQ